MVVHTTAKMSSIRLLYGHRIHHNAGLQQGADVTFYVSISQS